MTGTIHNKEDPTRLFYDFRVKLIVFMALTSCFRKNFMEFCFHLLYFLQLDNLVSRIKDPVSLGRINEPRQFFHLVSNVYYDFEYICFKTVLVNF